MDNELIKKYKQEMLNIKNRAVPTQVTPENQNTQPIPPLAPNSDSTEDSVGYLTAIVSTIRGLYPVPNAKVTIFTGNADQMNIIDTAVTDQSGKTKVFTLPTPQKNLSLDSNNATIPYSKYNMLVTADGYVDNIHLNIPVFSGVTSIQRSNMLLRETAGVNKGAQIFNEENNYNL